MSSAVKTLELLTFFSESHPEIGLSQLCKLAGRDKATTYRHLQSLEATGFVEQNPMSKQYRLGPAVLRLAQTRELTVPRRSGADAPLRALVDVVAETAHVSVLSDNHLYPLLSSSSTKHSTRVIIDVPNLPLHATASGLCALAFGPAILIDTALENLETYTASTAATAGDLKAAIATARETGIAVADGSFEDEVCSLAAPLFDQTGRLAGAVAVATVATRFNPDLERVIQHNLIVASREITRNWGGTIPIDIEAIWAKSFAHSQTMEPAS